MVVDEEIQIMIIYNKRFSQMQALLAAREPVGVQSRPFKYAVSF